MEDGRENKFCRIYQRVTVPVLALDEGETLSVLNLVNLVAYTNLGKVYSLTPSIMTVFVEQP